MANYATRADSNYFKVKDPAGFMAWCDRRGFEPCTKEDPEHGLLYGFYQDNSSGDGEHLDGSRWNEETEENEEFDCAQEVSEHLEPGWVCVAIEIGHEGINYLNAWGFAVNATGDVRRLDLIELLMAAGNLIGKYVTVPAY